MQYFGDKINNKCVTQCGLLSNGSLTFANLKLLICVNNCPNLTFGDPFLAICNMNCTR